MQQEEPNKYVKELTQEKYKYGFTTDVHTDIIERGLNEDVVRLISEKKGEPEWLLEFRLKAYRHWLTLEMPTWAHLRIPEIDYQAISYYADPTKKKEGPKSMDEVDPELIKTFNKLGIPLEEQMALSGMAVDAVMDSVSVKTTFKETLMEKGIIFCSFSEAVREHPDLVQKYLGSVVPRAPSRGKSFRSFRQKCLCSQWCSGYSCPDESSLFPCLPADGYWLLPHYRTPLSNCRRKGCKTDTSR